MSEGQMDSDPFVVEEVVHIDDEGEYQLAEVDNGTEKTQFAAVVFHNIAETYPVDAHIECKYTITSDIVPTTRDWVGLYKVGWMYPRDYIYYEWAPVPKDYEVGREAESSVLFQSHNLPEDDGEFYQFCYVASSAQIRGASTPFQFRKPSADDFVEIEDVDSDMLVIRSKTIFLQENLDRAETQKSQLLEQKGTIEKERDEIAAKYTEVKKKLTQSEKNSEALKGGLADSEAKVGQLQRESRDMMAVHDALRDKLTAVDKVNEDLERKISDLNAEIAALTSGMKKLQSEKDEIAGENKALLEQVNLFKSHFTSSATEADQYSKEKEELQLLMAQKESLLDHLRKAERDLRQELEATKETLNKQMAVSEQDQESIHQLEERLKNAEDKLSAAEDTKNILQAEMASYVDAQATLTVQIEKTKSENHTLKTKLNALEEDFQVKVKIQESELEQRDRDLISSQEEKSRIQEENSQLRLRLNSHLELTEVTTGSVSCMKQALDQLKDRLAKKDRQCRSLEKTLNQRQIEFQQSEHDLKREIEDLKERIFMCREEYKGLHIKNSKLERQVEKLSSKKRGKVERQYSSPVLMETERKQMSSDDTGPSDQGNTVVPEDVSMTTSLRSEALQEQMEDFELELQKRLLKKQKYKKLYAEEKEKCDSVSTKLQGEIRSKDEEISALKRRIDQLPNHWDIKVRALEKCVTEKEQTIEELNQKLRECNQERDDMKNGPSSPYKKAGPMPHAGNYPYPVCGNPFPTAVQMRSPQYPYPGPPPHTYMVYPHPPQHQPPMAYPQQQITYPQQQSPPMAYPLSPPIVYPGTPAPQFDCKHDELQESGSDRRSQSPASPLDREVENKEEITLDEPLTPLPAPIVPEKLQSTVSTGECDMPDGGQLLDVFETKLKVALPTAPTAPPVTEQKEDRFLDAVGEPMKLCPHCDKSFPADIDEEVFTVHQLQHIYTLCPICKFIKSESMSDTDFERHVNDHMDN